MHHWLVEKNNHNALHAIFDCYERAERHLKQVIPDYVSRGYFMDKTLTPDSFEIIPAPTNRKK
jgi:hypothetical protein